MTTANALGYQMMSASLQRHFASESFVALGTTYRLDLNDTDLSRLVSQLSADECARFHQLRHRTKRLEFLCGRILLRHTLAQLLGTSARTLMFRYGRYGKPYLAVKLGDATPELSFNLSHAGNHILLGVSQHGEIGVDIEVIDAYRADIARRYFHQDEYLHLETLPSSERSRAFYRVWTAKEACVKALGVGLRYPLCAVRVTLENAGCSAGVSWRRLDCGPAAEAVVAVQRRDRRATLGDGALHWMPIEHLLSEMAPC